MGFIPLPLALLVSRSFTGWLLILRCLLPRLLAYKCDDVFFSWSEWWPAQWRSRGHSRLCVCCCFTWGNWPTCLHHFWLFSWHCLFSCSRDFCLSVWAGWSLWRFSTVSFSWELPVCLSKRPIWRKSSLTLRLLSPPAVQTLELTGQNMFTFHRSKVAQSLCLTVSFPEFNCC